MMPPQGIPKDLPDNQAINFHKLREEGIQFIQALSGGVWTDYNLHDPGITTLEVLCYALTELGYRTALLKEALESGAAVETDFVNRYFFGHDVLLPHLPLTREDFAHFIEDNHPGVLSAWFEPYPLFQAGSTIRGGYEIALLLKPDKEFGNLNTDVIAIGLADATLEVIFFDTENNRLSWKDIRKITDCKWNRDDPDNFFVFETYNCQVALTLEVIYQNRRRPATLNTRARVTLNPLKKPKRPAGNLASRKTAIIGKLESTEFHEALARAVSREQHKAQIFSEVRQFLLPYRNLCEDFVSLRAVNEQEIKIEAEITLDTYAPAADEMINRVLGRLDTFLWQLLFEAKQPGAESSEPLLYASNLIEEMVKTEGVEAARILNLNLFVDGVPTIPLREETAFECIHLQRFVYYAPKISREKSIISFVRSGAREKADPNAVAREFKPPPHLFTGERATKVPDTERAKAPVLDALFFENLRQYHSIQNDFPQNYRLREGQLSGKAPSELKVRVSQFKAYLAFFERLLTGYLDQLYRFPDLMSVIQRPVILENELERLKKQVPGLDQLNLINAAAWKSDSAGRRKQLEKQHKLMDHLLARFATRYRPVLSAPSGIPAMEKTLQAKIRLLKDIPLITRERGLGLPVKTDEKPIWDNDLLSGFQKRVYRLLGVNNDGLKHLQLTKFRGNEPVGFYMVEHLLVARRKEKNIFSKKFNRAAELLFEYLTDLSEQDQKSDPYSFQLTLIVPNWYTEWYKRRNTIENIMRKELPAHILPYFYWLGKKPMSEFEILYEDWLKALLQLYKA